MDKPPIHLGLDVSYAHMGGRWRQAGALRGHTFPDVTSYEEVARMAERGMLDMVDRLLQHPATPLDPGRADARRGVRDWRGGEIGGLTTTRTKLNSVAKLSNPAGQPRRTRLMQPDACTEFSIAFEEECARAEKYVASVHSSRRRELEKVRQKLDELVEAIASGLRSTTLQTKLSQLEARQAELKQEVGLPPRPPLILLADLAGAYRPEVNKLSSSTNDAEGNETRELLRGLIQRVIITPASDGKGSEVELVGEIAAMIDRARRAEPAGNARLERCGDEFGTDGCGDKKPPSVDSHTCQLLTVPGFDRRWRISTDRPFGRKLLNRVAVDDVGGPVSGPIQLPNVPPIRQLDPGVDHGLRFRPGACEM